MYLVYLFKLLFKATENVPNKDEISVSRASV